MVSKDILKYFLSLLIPVVLLPFFYVKAQGIEYVHAKAGAYITIEPKENCISADVDTQCEKSSSNCRMRLIVYNKNCEDILVYNSFDGERHELAAGAKIEDINIPQNVLARWERRVFFLKNPTKVGPILINGLNIRFADYSELREKRYAVCNEHKEKEPIKDCLMRTVSEFDNRPLSDFEISYRNSLSRIESLYFKLKLILSRFGWL